MTEPSAEDCKRTPLYDVHKRAKAKMVPFGGWLMPVSYTSVLDEHKAVREACGLFDVSHMGEVMVRGKGAEAFLQKLAVNDITRLKDGAGQYSAILHPHGGMIDDLIIYRLKSDHYLICVNASNATKDYTWIKSQASNAADVKVDNESTQWSQIAVQGPNSRAVVAAVLAPDEKAKLETLAYTNIMPAKLGGKPGYVARTGYTGEWGYELYMANDVAAKVWDGLMETAPQHGTKPIGLGARDTLRLEACYLLYGNDMNDQVSPLEAGIGWAVRLDAGDFIGRDALVKQKEKGLERLGFAFKMTEDGIPRHDMECFKDGVKIGKVTSGSVLPTLGGSGGMALLDPRRVKAGDTFEIDVRGKMKPAVVHQKPLYKARVK